MKKSLPKFLLASLAAAAFSTPGFAIDPPKHDGEHHSDHEHADHDDDGHHHDDDDDKSQTTKEVRVEVVQVAGENGEILEKVKERLAKTDLSEEQIAEILASVKKGLAAAKSGKGKKEMKLRVQVDDESRDGKTERKLQWNASGEEGEIRAILVDEDGESQNVDLGDANVIIRMDDAGSGGILNLRKLNDASAHMEAVQKILAEKGLGADAIADAVKGMNTFTFRADDDSATLAEIGVPRYVLGIQLNMENSVTEEDGDVEETRTVTISEVFPESAADEAGVEAGDILVSVNGEKITEPETLIASVQEAGQEDGSIGIVVLRGDAKKKFKIKPKLAEQSMESFPEELREAYNRVKSAKNFAIEIPSGEGGAQAFNLRGLMQGGGQQAAMKELKEEVESLKKDLKEIKSMLRKLKDD